jgi:hypothetical protein
VYDVCWHVQSSLTFNDLVSSIKTNSLTAASAVEIEERDIPGIPAGPHTGIVNSPVIFGPSFLNRSAQKFLRKRKKNKGIDVFVSPFWKKSYDVTLSRSVAAGLFMPNGPSLKEPLPRMSRHVSSHIPSACSSSISWPVDENTATRECAYKKKKKKKKRLIRIKTRRRSKRE